MGAEVTMENNTVKDVRFVLSIPLLSNVRVHLHGENRWARRRDIDISTYLSHTQLRKARRDNILIVYPVTMYFI